jgi:hypothetical protein
VHAPSKKGKRRSVAPHRSRAPGRSLSPVFLSLSCSGARAQTPKRRAYAHARPFPMRSCKRTRTAAAAVALVVTCLAAVLPGSSATLVSAVEAVTRGIGAKLQEFKGGEGLVVSPADIEGLLNTPCGEFFVGRVVGCGGGGEKWCRGFFFPRKMARSVLASPRRKSLRFRGALGGHPAPIKASVSAQGPELCDPGVG